MKKWPKLELHTRIILGLLAGVALGLGFGPRISWIEPLGTIFVRAVIMVIVPLVFSSLFTGTVSLGDIRRLGRIGAKTLTYYLVTTVIAILLGLLVVNLVKPGKYVSPETKVQLLADYRQTQNVSLEKLEARSWRDILVEIVPQNPVRALLEANMLQIIFMALFLGVAVMMLPQETGEPLVRFFSSLNDAVAQLIHLIMKLAPVGVAALIAVLVGKFGYHILLTLLIYVLTVAVGMVAHTFVVLPLSVRWLGRTGIGEFLRGMRDIMYFSFSTSSSAAALPLTMETVEKRFHVPAYVSSFVLPLGATINQNGTALYQAVAAVFIAQVYGIPLGLSAQLTIVVMATLASIGTAGVPMAGTVTLTLILAAIHVPIEGIALILAVDRLPDMMRTVANVLGDAAAALVVARSEGTGE
jgi:Na+/H+-dicarboxylate symporter